jgi:hypothetical protein
MGKILQRKDKIKMVRKGFENMPSLPNLLGTDKAKNVVVEVL